MANNSSYTARRRHTGSALARALAWVSALSCAGLAVASQAAEDPARIQLAISSSAARLEPGSTIEYVVRVQNSGGNPHGARLTIASPEGLANVGWSCASLTAGTCPRASGQGWPDESLDGLASGGSLEFRVDATVAIEPPPFVELAVSTSLPASARCATGETSPCRSQLVLPTGPELSLGITSTAAAFVPGQAVAYTIEVRSDSSRSRTLGTRLRSPVPKGLINSSWTCHSSAGACQASSGSGDLEQMLGDFVAGEVQFQVRATVSQDPPATVVPAAVAIPPYGGSCVAGSGVDANTASSPCTARIALATRPQIWVSTTPDYSRDGLTVENRFVLENRGTRANGCVLALEMPAGVSALTWTCSAIGATCPQSSGSGPIRQTVADWPTSGRLHYDIVSQRNSLAAGDSALNMSVTPPESSASCGAAELPPPCLSHELAVPAHGFLRIAERVDRLGAAPGQSVTYAVSVANDSAEQSARDLILEVPLPEGVAAFESWTCEATAANAHCPVAVGSGTIRQFLAELAPSAGLVYSINARVAPAAPARIASSARLVAPASASLGCRTSSRSFGACVASAEFSTVPVLALDQSRLAGNLSPGGQAGYTLDVFNLGADTGAVRIDNRVPIGFSSAAWACTGLGVGCPAAAGVGEISAALEQMPAGSGLHYQVSARVDATAPSAIANVLTAVPMPGGRCHRSASESLSSAPCVDRIETGTAPLLQLTQTAREKQVLVGGTANYAITLKNLGSLASDTLLHVPLPEGIDRFDWTCTAFAGAICPRASSSGPIDESIAALPSDGSLDYAIRAVIDADAGASVASLATATPAAPGRCVGDACAADVRLPLAQVPAAHLDVSATSSRAWAPAGSSASWKIDIRNLGAEVATDLSIRNLQPQQGLIVLGWTCEGIECPAASGTGPIEASVPSLAVYDPASSEQDVAPGRLLYTVNTRVEDSPGPSANLATVLAPSPGDTCAPVNCRVDSTLPTDARGISEVTIDLQADTFTAVPNSTIQYTFSIINTGGAGVTNINAYNVEPPQIASSTWTCSGTGGAICAPSGTGTINELISSMPVGSGVTFNITAQTGSDVQPSIDYLVGANVSAPVTCVPVSCTFPLSIQGEDELTLSLVADVTEIVPDGTVQYTYRVDNTGGGDQFGINLFTVEPPDFFSTSWTCVASGGANCTPAGVGPVNDLISFFPIGSSVTYTIDAFAASSLAPIIDFQGGAAFGGQPGATSAPEGVLNCVPVGCLVTLSLPRGVAEPAQLSISKTPDRSFLEPGGDVRYSIQLVNTGDTDVNSIQFSDLIPSGLESFSWTCSATGDGFCQQTSGTGPIDEFIESLPISSSLTYIVDAVVSATASGNVSNRAVVVADNAVCSPSSCQAVSSLPVQSAATIAVTKTASPASGTPVAPGDAISWTLIASNTGGPTSAAVVLTDSLPNSVSGISVVAGSGVSCNTVAPAAGSELICTVAAGFTGTREVQISATVSAGAGGSVSNTVSTSGADGPVCISCTVSNPVQQGVDAGLANPRAFSAAGIAGTLLDVVNLSSTGASSITLSVSPGSALRLLAAYAGGCTASEGSNGTVTVSCPNPPSAQGISCSGASCSLASLPPGAAATLFVGLNPGATATVSVAVPGDVDPSDNSIVLPIGATP